MVTATWKEGLGIQVIFGCFCRPPAPIFNYRVPYSYAPPILAGSDPGTTTQAVQAPKGVIKISQSP